MRYFLKGGVIGAFAGACAPAGLIFLGMLVIWCAVMDRALYSE